jgi:methanogenic corrinoid protein MtbC1
MDDRGAKLVQQIEDMQEEESVKLAGEMLESGYDPIELLRHCREAMELVGKRYAEGEYFLPELMLAGEMLKTIGEMAKPLIKQDTSGAKTAGTVVLGTVQGDLHDIGKNIVTFMLEINGFKVVDLGIDVPIANFIESIKEHKPQVVGLSGFLTLAFDAMKTTVEAINEAGLRGNIKIMIGGGQVDETIRNYTGADAFGLNAMDAVSLCKEWVPA